VFVAEDGAPLHPDFLTRRFRHLVGQSGLPPVRLHDLRHGAASLAHCAGVDLKTVQAQLGHSSIVLTADTYTSVLTDLLAYAAEVTARLVLAAAARNPPIATAATAPHRQPLGRLRSIWQNGP
jgi:integrase